MSSWAGLVRRSILLVFNRELGAQKVRRGDTEVAHPHVGGHFLGAFAQQLLFFRALLALLSNLIWSGLVSSSSVSGGTSARCLISWVINARFACASANGWCSRSAWL